jgi:hypothetical protein
MDDPTTEESDLPWDDDRYEEQDEQERQSGTSAESGVIFPPHERVSSIFQASWYDELPCEITPQYANWQHHDADRPPTDDDQASRE